MIILRIINKKNKNNEIMKIKIKERDKNNQNLLKYNNNI